MNLARKTIEVIADKGWIKGNYQKLAGSNPDDPWNRPGVCLYGGFRLAIKEFGSIFDIEGAERSIIDVIVEQFPERQEMGQNEIPSFNDHKDTRIEDVVMVLEKAAVKLDEVV